MSEYVYILINSSMKDLLKIGMTSRTPDERAKELSKNTNMPTPFFVAYEEKVPNGRLAEELIHDSLAEEGYRVSDSREFFAIPLKEAIRIVSSVAEQVCLSNDNVAQMDIEEEDNIESIADYYYMKGVYESLGNSDTLQDDKAAVASFQRACDLGSIHAYPALAHHYFMGKGVRQSLEKSLEILKEGGRKGSSECFATMWDIYRGDTIFPIENELNAELCFKWLIESSETNSDDVLLSKLDDYLRHAYKKKAMKVANFI